MLRSTSRTHPHPPPPAQIRDCDVLVIGGGHAGIEAAAAAARLGASVVLATFRADRIGEMSCNPAIGGQGKGQLVREVDALGGLMGLAADATGIQFHVLNTTKGYAVRGPRCQSDRHLYREDVTRRLLALGVRIVEGAIDGLCVGASASGAPRVRGARCADGREIVAHATVITTGTFLAAIMHTGEAQAAGGRVGELTTSGISSDLRRLGLALGRLKTGTPPRLARDSIDWERLEPHTGDAQPIPFSFRTDRARFPAQRQIACHITYTNERTHALIRANIQRAPMYAGRIQGVGPRYCPSVEDKVMRFADKERHQLFLEPESLSTDVIYVNGISTSLPGEVQEAFVRTIPGLERARFLRHGYAVEYDFSVPSQLDPSFAVRAVEGLYLAGQINGTSGYEEAAAQGLVAGANAALWSAGRAPLVLGRDEAYIGVLADDLVVSAPTEPYRMFSSRAEHRLLLRADDADRRLTPLAHELGLVDAAQHALHAARMCRLEAARHILATQRDAEQGNRTLLELLRRPEVTFASLCGARAEFAALALSPDDEVTLEADIKYAGYSERARRDVERLSRDEHVEIPGELDITSLKGLRREAREKLLALRPRTLGQAARISGINPPDVALLSIHVERWRRERTAT
jgi:tRNA uridine 5-carboxymethylaminomethyl modification enzyme